MCTWNVQPLLYSKNYEETGQVWNFKSKSYISKPVKLLLFDVQQKKIYSLKKMNTKMKVSSFQLCDSTVSNIFSEGSIPINTNQSICTSFHKLKLLINYNIQ